MTLPNPRAVWIDDETKAALKEYAWLNRTNMSAVIRSAIQDIIDNAGNVSVLAEAEGIPVAKNHIGIRAEDEWWERALEAANSTPYSFASLLRRRLRKILHEEGLLA